MQGRHSAGRVGEVRVVGIPARALNLTCCPEHGSTGGKQVHPAFRHCSLGMACGAHQWTVMKSTWYALALICTHKAARFSADAQDRWILFPVNHFLPCFQGTLELLAPPPSTLPMLSRPILRPCTLLPLAWISGALAPTRSCCTNHAHPRRIPRIQCMAWHLRHELADPAAAVGAILPRRKRRAAQPQPGFLQGWPRRYGLLHPDFPKCLGHPQ